MKILADQYLYKIDEVIPDSMELHLFNPNSGFPNHATEFDALLIRTVSEINASTLPQAGNLKFIGSATAGFDHVDTEHLNKLGITFGRSAGCNARAVAEYIITVLHRWAQQKRMDLSTKKVGVIGCGHTGGALLDLLQKLNIECIPYDPPKAQRETRFKSVSLQELLACDILTFHTPLTFDGPHPTYHLCNEQWLRKGFDLIINSSRGGVVDENNLQEAYTHHHIKDYILDVWEDEPYFSDQSAKQAFISTPHIAGYSREAKFQASKLVVDQMCQFFGVRPKQVTHPELPDKKQVSLKEDITFSDFLWENNQIEYYDTELRKLIGLPNQDKGAKFASIRSETPTRFEYRSIVNSISNQPMPDRFQVFD